MPPASSLPVPFATTVPPAPKPQFLWNEIVRWSLEACILRNEGQEGKVAELLRERLPELIRDWSASCGLPAETCKQNLRALFRRVQESVEAGTIHRRLIVDEVCARLAATTAGAGASPRPADRGPVRLHRRVPVGDIPGMLDAIAEAELDSRTEAVLPLRPAALAMLHLFSSESAPPTALSA